MVVYLDGAWRTVKSAKIYLGGVWRNISSGKMYLGGAWRDIGAFVDPMAVSIGPNPFHGGTRAGTIANANVTATPSGGLAPFTYAWTILVADTSTTLTNANQATVTVSGDVSGGGSDNVDLQCVVTDSLGTSVAGTASGALFFIDTGTTGGGF